MIKDATYLNQAGALDSSFKTNASGMGFNSRKPSSKQPLD